MSKTGQQPQDDSDGKSPAQKLAEFEEEFEMIAEEDVPFSDQAERALEIINARDT